MWLLYGASLRVRCVGRYTAKEGCVCGFCWKSADLVCLDRVNVALDEWHSEVGIRRDKMMGQYNVAKAVLSFFSIVGWILIGLGALIAVYSIVNSGLSLLMPSLALAISGVLTIATTQMGLAQIATAENTYAIYDLVKANLANSPKGTNSFVRDAVSSTTNLKEGVRRIKVYKGREILKTKEGVVVGDEVFGNVIEAEKYISAQENT